MERKKNVFRCLLKSTLVQALSQEQNKAVFKTSAQFKDNIKNNENKTYIYLFLYCETALGLKQSFDILAYIAKTILKKKDFKKSHSFYYVFCQTALGIKTIDTAKLKNWRNFLLLLLAVQRLIKYFSQLNVRNRLFPRNSRAKL